MTLGPIHLATDDIGILRTLINMTIIAPCDSVEMNKLIEATIKAIPIYNRLGKGGDKIITEEKETFIIGKGIIKKEPHNGLLLQLSYVPDGSRGLQNIKKENINCGVMHMHTIKPLDGNLINQYFPKIQSIVTVEEHSIVEA